jgi:hypothetical protein
MVVKGFLEESMQGFILCSESIIMLTSKQIMKCAKLTYRIETLQEGTFYGYKIGEGPSCCYGKIPELREKQAEEKRKAEYKK